MDPLGQEADVNVLSRRPSGSGLDVDAQHIGGSHGEGGALEAVLDEDATLGVEPRECVEGTCSDEVVPRREDMITVKKEEDDEYDSGEEVGGLEELVEVFPWV